MRKLCFRCGERKLLVQFYEHPQMADGHLGKCKRCTRKDVRQHRRQHPRQIKRYEQLRAARPERKRAQSVHQAAYRSRNPLKYKARTSVSNALRDGRLTKGPCANCGTTKRVQAHHRDYDRPLDVEWLCFRCHRQGRHGQIIT